jgi:hypothetical protein
MIEKKLKMGLRQIANEGWFAVKVNNEFVDSLLAQEYDPPSEELKQHFLSKLRLRIQDAAILRAHRVLDPKVVPFGQFIASVREIAYLTRTELAAQLRKEVAFVQEVERGDVGVLRLAPTDVADLLFLFRIKIEDAVQMANASLAFARSVQEDRRAVRRTRGGVHQGLRNRDAEGPMEAREDKLKRRLARRQARLSEEVQAFLSSLRKELASRG